MATSVSWNLPNHISQLLQFCIDFVLLGLFLLLVGIMLILYRQKKLPFSSSWFYHLIQSIKKTKYAAKVNVESFTISQRCPSRLKVDGCRVATFKNKATTPMPRRDGF